MEPVGLAVGLVGLVGLFNTCLDVIDKVDSYKDFGIESRSVYAQFEADKQILKQWAQHVGIENGGLGVRHHRHLDDADTMAAVRTLLSSIHEIFGKTERTALNRQPAMESGRNSSLEIPHRGTRIIQQPEPDFSRRDRIGWSLKRKGKITNQVQQFGSLVQRLYTLVPVENLKDAGVEGPGSRDSRWHSEYQQNLRQIRKHIEGEMRMELQTWLDASWTNHLYDNFVGRKLDGTCDWIQNRPAFIDWASPEFPDGSAKMLWIHGPAGFGKTILCANVVKHLLATPDSLVAFFFFSSETGSRGDPFIVIRSWILQVISRDQSAFELACSKCDSKTGQTATRTEILELFQAIVTILPRCTFVVDGLDECAKSTESWTSHEDSSTLGLLKAIKQSIAHTATKVLIVSRADADIRSGFHFMAYAHRNILLYEQAIKADDVQTDATIFSRSVVDKKLGKKDQQLRMDLSHRMVERSGGMFLWIKMLEDQLRGGKNKKQLEEIVDHAPTGLHHLYERNWKNISLLQDRDQARAFSILRWTVCALRPLSVAELVEALVINDDDLHDLPIDELPDAIDKDYIHDEILSLCGSLLETRSTDSEHDPATWTVEPIHFSAKQYILLQMTLPGTLNTNEQLNKALQNNIIASLCLRYLNFSTIWQPPDTTISWYKKRPLRNYAAGSWYQHFSCQVANSAEVDHLVQKLFQPGSAKWIEWRKWFENDKRKPAASKVDPNSSPLFYAATLGLCKTVSHLIREKRVEINQRDGFGRTALIGACSESKHDAAKLLLMQGADPTIADNYGRTPLQLSSANGSLDIVKLLLEKGAGIATASSEGWTPLNSASDNGHLEVVKVFLEKGADIA
ncbi:hypothetical protein B0H66DRAFT_506168, partial [Apodospora peruviana]